MRRGVEGRRAGLVTSRCQASSRSWAFLDSVSSAMF